MVFWKELHEHDFKQFKNSIIKICLTHFQEASQF